MRKALLIGCNYVNSSAELRGCINDVISVKQFLMQEHGFLESEIKIMTDLVPVVADRPTKANILRNLSWLVANNQPTSRLFLHYSGHGTYVRDRNGDEADGQDECLCPLDYMQSGLILDDDIRRLLVDPLVDGAQLFFLCDSCHSGTMADLKYKYTIVSTPAGVSYTISTDNKYQPSKANVMFVSGSRDSETSADAYISGKFQGAMTYCFIKAWADMKREGKPITYKRLMKSLLTLIKANRFAQNPQIASGKFVDLGQEIFFGK